jgi:hypothetical protein
MTRFLHDILHTLVEHSTVGGQQKADLHAMVDGKDPAEAAAEAADQEIADLEAKLAAARAAKQAPDPAQDAQ